ncbi:MAG: hypothetical protein LUD51_05700 [Clostridia bacterium]|nr:hypothetical protein [Clostridia bacterium]
MLSGEKFRHALDPNSRENVEGARKLLEKYNGQDAADDDCTASMFCRCFLDATHSKEIDETELLMRIRATVRDPSDDLNLYAVMSALKWYDVYYLEDTDENGNRCIPAYPVKICGRTYPALLCFTSEKMVKPGLRVDYSIKKGTLPQILRSRSGGTIEDIRALCINPFDRPLDIDVFSFMDAMDDMGTTEVSTTLIMMKGVDGEELFPILIDGFTGFKVVITLTNGIEVTGTVLDTDFDTMVMTLGDDEGGSKMPVRVSSIQRIRLYMPDSTIEYLKKAGFKG